MNRSNSPVTVPLPQTATFLDVRMLLGKREPCHSSQYNNAPGGNPFDKLGISDTNM